MVENATTACQNTIDNFLRALKNENIRTYLDDIIIISVFLQEYIEKLKSFVQCLRESKLKIQLDKSEYLR